MTTPTKSQLNNQKKLSSKQKKRRDKRDRQPSATAQTKATDLGDDDIYQAVIASGIMSSWYDQGDDE